MVQNSILMHSLGNDVFKDEEKNVNRKKNVYIYKG